MFRMLAASMLTRRGGRVFAASAGCSAVGYSSSARCEGPKVVATTAVAIESDAMPTSKGSFLLNATPGKDSIAAQLAGEKAKDSLNKKLGLQLIAQRDKQMAKNVSVFYKQDGGLVITKGEGVHLIDVDGNKHLDCCNNVAHVGHSHPRVVEAGCNGLRNIQTNSRFLNPVQQRYLSKLLATFPPELDTVYLVNSGTEANDLALRMARDHTKAKNPKDVICLEGAYHGHSQAIVDISPYKWAQATDGKNYRPDTTHVVTLPDSFRGPHRGMTAESGAKYAEEVEEVVKSTGGVGVFIHESILGCGGQIVPPPTYLQKCYDAVKGAGGVCIADEVQTGFGRAGDHFWMFQHHGVSPDIVTVGKPMGNGYPVAAVICRREVAESFSASGIEYFNTYGGNAVACAIAEAVIDTIHEEDLQGNSKRMGAYIHEKFLGIKEKFDWVGDVRGVGLYRGIEFVKSRAAGEVSPDAVFEPHPDLAKFVVDFLKFENVIVSRDGPEANVVKVKPPIIFSRENVDTLMASMERALEQAEKSGRF